MEKYAKRVGERVEKAHAEEGLIGGPGRPGSSVRGNDCQRRRTALILE